MINRQHSIDAAWEELRRDWMRSGSPPSYEVFEEACARAYKEDEKVTPKIVKIRMMEGKWPEGPR